MRIDIELTSQRPDGSWTWRAANAKQPRGIVESDLLYSGAAVGHVVRAEAHSSIDGVTVVSVTPPPAREADPNRVERIERQQRDVDYAQLAERVGKPRRDSRPGDRGERRPSDRNDRPGRDRPGRDRTPRDGARDTSGAPRSGDRPQGQRVGDNRNSAGRGGRRPERTPTNDWRDKGDRKGKAPRHTVRRVHRDAVLASVPEEHRPIAQLLLVGGLPSVRARLDEQTAADSSTTETPTNREAILALAEELLPKIRAAEWRDRAEAAEKAGDSLPMRELRSIINTADVAGRDEECRALADRLRGALRARSERERGKWLDSLRASLADGRTVRALRDSARPPDAGARLPADLATALADAASAAMTADTNADRWAAVLEATLLSPVKRHVHPAALPAGASAEFTTMVGDATGHIPALAKLLGVALPPPPNPKAAEFAHSFVRDRAAAADPEPSPAPADTPADPAPAAAVDTQDAEPSASDFPVPDSPGSDSPASDSPGSDSPGSDSPVPDSPVTENAEESAATAPTDAITTDS